MRHEDFRARLDDLVDGCLADAVRLDLEQHAAVCPACAQELAAARELQARARALPRSLPTRRDLWPALAAELRRPAPAAAASRRRLALLPALWPRRLGFAAAGAALAAALALWLGRPSERAPQPPDEMFPALISGLERECMGAGRTLVAVFALPAGPAGADLAAALGPGLSAGLGVLDASIAEMRAALAADPGNGALQRKLAEGYQRKLALLDAAVRRVEASAGST